MSVANKIQKIEIYTDGACRGNPGAGGWGVLIRYGEHEISLKGSSSMTTNNKMELTAAIEGLKHLNKLEASIGGDLNVFAAEIHITTDSTYVKNGITQWIFAWKKKNWRSSSGLPVKNQELWQELDAQVLKFNKVNWHWVRGHSGHQENEYVDALANQAIDTLSNLG